MMLLEGGEVVVINDDDYNGNDDDGESFIFDDLPNDDGYCDDGEGNDDAYSINSPKPCTINDDDPGLNEIEPEEEEDMSVEDTSGKATIEAAKKDQKDSGSCNRG